MSPVLNTGRYGFTEGLSCQSAILQFTAEVYKLLEQKNHVVALFLDQSKAFDLVDFDILLSKLELYGIRGTAYNMFNTYLRGRSQFVESKCRNKSNSNSNRKFKSKNLNLEKGVPQGSILGPILFLLYINDLGFQFKEKIVLYADDTNLILSGKTEFELSENISSSLNLLSKWFDVNKLVVSLEKTKCMSLSNSNSSKYQPPVSYNSSKVDYVNFLKLLGVYIDNNMKWKTQNENLSKKLSSAVFLLRSLQNKLDKDTLKIVYHSNFHSHLKYGVSFWGQSTDWRKIFVLQKKAVRILHGRDRDSSGMLIHCKELFKTFKILTLLCQHIYDTILLTLSEANRKNLKFLGNVNGRETRNSNTILLPAHKTALYSSSASYSGSKYFNCLPREMRESPFSNTFKKQLKSFLLENAFYSLNEYEQHCSRLCQGNV